MKKLLLSIFFTYFIGQLQAQQCGTETPLTYQLAPPSSMAQNMRTTGTTYFVPLKVHFITKSDGSKDVAFDELNLAQQISEMNQTFSNMNIRFYKVGDVNVIAEDDYYNNDVSLKENEITQNHFEPKTINLYYSKNVLGRIAYTRLPPTTVFNSLPSSRIYNVIFQSYSASNNTLIHEMGHFFGLLHTFGPGNCAYKTNELANGSNCSTTGDRICDTPADPVSGVIDNLIGCRITKVNIGTCEYVGTDLDANGQAYSPLNNNFMSYFPVDCKTSFTNGQYEAMRNTAFYQRYYLLKCQQTHFLLLEDKLICEEYIDEEGYITTECYEDIVTDKEYTSNYQIIIQNHIVDNGKNLILKAEQEVILKPGFEVVLGGNLEAKIVESCVPQPIQNNNGQRSTRTVVEANQVHQYQEFNIYPNPARTQITVSYQVDNINQSVFITLSDVSGQTIKKLFNQASLDTGHYQQTFDIKTLKSGVYFLTLQVDDHKTTKRLIVIK